MSRLGFLALAVGLLAPTATWAQPVDVAGTWHVLVHYKDTAVTNKDAERWDDRVWVIERSGQMLRWSEYPIVVLDDETGRFEARRGTRRARKLNYWEPTAEQIAELQQGPRVNDRGSVSKKLRSAGPTAWKSLGSAGPVSASVITFSATWTIDAATTLPVFKQADVMGGGLTDSMEGMTLYETQSVEDGGNVLRGRFERDGTRSGTFRLLRTPAPRDLGTEEEQRARIREREVRDFITSDAELQRELRSVLDESLAENGVFMSRLAIDDLILNSVQIQGRVITAPEQLAKQVLTKAVKSHFAFAQTASHDDSVLYRLPFDDSTPRQLVQGPGGTFDHKDRHEHSFDFEMPEGTPVLAARAGKVVAKADDFTAGGPRKELRGRTNALTILHEDGSFATYQSIQPGVELKEGDAVEAGTLIAKSGHTGYSNGPHLGFAVWVLDGDRKARTVPIRFTDGSAEGFVPETGEYYGKARAAAN